jgi:transcriptional regulator with XRE-family HTH domain
MNYSKALRVSMIKSGLSQIDLAKKSGVTVTTLSKISNGKVIPSTRTLHFILKALKVTYQEFEVLGE